MDVAKGIGAGCLGTGDCIAGAAVETGYRPVQQLSATPGLDVDATRRGKRDSHR
jgi:hypothetical protein